MCGDPILLVKSSSERFIARCACGCLHLVWDNTTIRLREWELQSLLRCLNAEASATNIDLECEPFGKIHIWLGSSGLRLDSEGFHAFQDMVRGAAEALEPHTPALGFGNGSGGLACRTLNILN